MWTVGTNTPRTLTVQKGVTPKNNSFLIWSCNGGHVLKASHKMSLSK